MKTSIAYGTVVLWTTLLIAMENPCERMYRIALKLTTNQITRGRVLDIPCEQEKSECILEQFLFTLIRKQESNDPLFELSIKTADEHKFFIGSLTCPLLPNTTSSVSFTLRDKTYSASLTPIKLNPY